MADYFFSLTAILCLAGAGSASEAAVQAEFIEALENEDNQ